MNSVALFEEDAAGCAAGAALDTEDSFRRQGLQPHPVTMCQDGVWRPVLRPALTLHDPHAAPGQEWEQDKDQQHSNQI